MLVGCSVSSPGAVGDFDSGALAAPASATRRGAVARPGAAPAGAHAVRAVVVVAGLPRRPGAEAPVGGLVAKLGERERKADRSEPERSDGSGPSPVATGMA